MRDLETTRAAILHVVEELKRLDNRLAWISKNRGDSGPGLPSRSSTGREARHADRSHVKEMSLSCLCFSANFLTQ